MALWTLRRPTRTIDIGFIKDEDNLETPWRGPSVDMHTLSEVGHHGVFSPRECPLNFRAC